MWIKLRNVMSKAGASSRAGFGIMEVMVSVLVLGFMYMALNQLQKSNDEAVHRLRCRDGAVQVAQEIMDSLKAIGSAAIVSNADENTQVLLDERERQWERALGGMTTVKYVPKLTVLKTSDYEAQSKSKLESIQHIYAKQVNLQVEWKFKGGTQSINVSGVIR